MADEENKNEIMDKLKELEASLAKELDQKIRLVEPSDPRLEGGIEVNPNMGEALRKAQAALEVRKLSDGDQAIMDAAAAAETPAPATPLTPRQATVPPAPTPSVAPAPQTMVENQEKKVDEISLQDVDELLNDLDAGFQASMNEIKSEISKIEISANLESLPIGSDYLKEAEGKSGAEGAVETPVLVPEVKKEPILNVTAPLGEMIRALLIALAYLPINAFKSAKKNLPQIKLAPRDVLTDILQTILDDIRHCLDLTKAVVKKLLSYPKKTYLNFAVLAVVILAFLLVVRDVYYNFQTSDEEKDPFLRNFNDVADSVQVLRDEQPGEDLESPLKHPEYTVLIHRMIANLKSPSVHASPMVTLELYVEASNQECAIEISKREEEIKDIIERVLEETSFDDLDTAPGKVRLKVRIRRDINRVLNKGSINKVMFKTLNMHK